MSSQESTKKQTTSAIKKNVRRSKSSNSNSYLNSKKVVRYINNESSTSSSSRSSESYLLKTNKRTNRIKGKRILRDEKDKFITSAYNSLKDGKDIHKILLNEIIDPYST